MPNSYNGLRDGFCKPIAYVRAGSHTSLGAIALETQASRMLNRKRVPPKLNFQAGTWKRAIESTGETLCNS